jgi:hypothetical protein
MLRITAAQSGTPLADIPAKVARAQARALTGLAFDVRDALREEMGQVFDKPNAFTLNAFRVDASQAQSGNVTVWAMPRQAKYLFWEVEGGDRASKGFEHKLGLFGGRVAVPVGKFASAYDARPKSFVGRLIRAIEEGDDKKLSRFFVGKPRNGNRPEGIWYRTSKRRIHMVMAFEDKAQYTERFDVEAVAEKNIGLRWESQLLRHIGRA